MGNRLWVLGAVLISIGILALGWVLGVSVKLAEGDTAILDRQNVEAQNQAQEAALVALKDKFDNLDDLEADLAELQKSIPASHELDVYFDRVAALAATSGVTFQNVTASEATPYGGTAVDPAAPTDTATAAPDGGTATLGPQLDPNLANQLFTIGISITVIGTPDQVFAFVDAVQKDDRLSLITTVSYALDSDQSDGEVNLDSAAGPSATITGFVFVVRDPAVAP